METRQRLLYWDIFPLIFLLLSHIIEAIFFLFFREILELLKSKTMKNRFDDCAMKINSIYVFQRVKYLAYNADYWFLKLSSYTTLIQSDTIIWYNHGKDDKKIKEKHP